MRYGQLSAAVMRRVRVCMSGVSVDFTGVCWGDGLFWVLQKGSVGLCVVTRYESVGE